MCDLKRPLTYSDEISWIETIWDALERLDEEGWDDICLAMIWIMDSFNIYEDDEGYHQSDN